LQQRVSKNHKQKRAKLEPTQQLTRCEQDAWWIAVEGVRDLVGGQNEGERFWRWLSGEVLPQLHRSNDLSLPPQPPLRELQDEMREAATVLHTLQADTLTNLRMERQKAELERQLLQLQLAKAVHEASETFGLETPAALRPERLAFAPAPEQVATEASQEEIDRVRLALDRERLTNARLENKLQRTMVALQARKMAAECGWDVKQEQLLAERQALELAAAPAHLDEGGWMTAGDYLRLRGHTEDEVQRLQSSFGRSLKAHHELQRGEPPDTVLREYGQDLNRTCVYHTQRDRALLNASYQHFTLTDLYRRTVPPAMQAINNL
jgi:prophage antirepressor-like protein